MPEVPSIARSAYPEERLKGLRQYTLQQKQATVERLRTAILALKTREEAITVHTIRAECGLDYQSYARNPEARALFREHSTFLATKRKGARTKCGKQTPKGMVQAKDPLLNYKKAQVITRLRQEMQQREALELHYRQLLEEQVASDLRILRLEAELAKYHEFLGQFREQVHRQEHAGPPPTDAGR